MLPEERKAFLKKEIKPKLLTVSRSLGNENIKYFLGFLASLKSEETIRAYKSDLMQFFEYLLKKGVPVLLVERYHIEVYGKLLERPNSKRKGLSKSSVKRKLTAISKFYTYLVRCNLLKESPALYIERPRVGLTVKTDPIPGEVLKKILDATNDSNLMEITHKLVIYLFFTTGLRASEGRNLKIGDYKNSSLVRKLTIKAKGDKYLEKTLSKKVGDLLDQYLLELKRNGYPMDENLPLIRAAHGKDRFYTPLSRQSITKIIKRFCRIVGYEDGFSSHSARATFITEALEHFDIGKVAETVGHSSVTMTNEYDKRRKNVSKEIGDFILGE